MTTRPLALALLLTIFQLSYGCAPADEPSPTAGQETIQTLRVAVFNVWELSAEKVDQLDDAGRGAHPQLRAAAEVIQRQRPDILLLNEIDVLAERNLAVDFVERYLALAQHPDIEPIHYEHVVYEPVNTGVPSGFDLNNDDEVGGPDDAWGFGRYPGQYGMAVLSRFPVDRDGIRSWRLLPWRSLPGHRMPDGANGRPDWYSAEEAEQLRLSSKTHLDVPVRVPGHDEPLHLLASHPTPPVFDGDEDRNGRRNFDEIRLWAEILDATEASDADEAWLVDDQDRAGGLPAEAPFVLLGDLNADPFNEPVYGRTAISQLLEHPTVRDPLPEGPGEPPGARVPADEYPGPPGTRTAAYGRLDYVLPSADLEVASSGVFVPAEGDALRRLVEGDERASDHFLVWVDLVWK